MPQPMARRSPSPHAVIAVVLTALVVAEALVRDSWLLHASLGAVLCVTAVHRRRLPAWTPPVVTVGVAVVAAAALVLELDSLPGVSASAALLVLGAHSARTASRHEATVVGIAGLAALVVGRWGLGDAAWVTSASLGALAWSGALSVGYWARRNDRDRQRAVQAARRDERIALARDLHDVAAHHLTGIVLQAQAAQPVTDPRSPEVDRSLVRIESAASDALDAVRAVVGLLRHPDGGGPMAEREALGALVERFAATVDGVHYSAPPEEVLRRWPDAVAAAVHRVVQEALTNVLRHSPSSGRVDIVVEQRCGAVVVRIDNDRAPARVPGGDGLGLIGMRERVESLGGSVEFGTPGDGTWTVAAVIPVDGRGSGPR